MANIKVGDSIEEVYCDLAVKLNGNIAVNAFLSDEVNFFYFLGLQFFKLKKG